MGGTTDKDNQSSISSPDSQLRLQVGVDSSLGAVWYELYKADRAVIKRSHLAIYNQTDDNLLSPSGEVAYRQTSSDETWEQPWGEQRFVRNNYTELELSDDNFKIRFRLFNDGLGFRYELLGDGHLVIGREKTEFNLDLEASAWWIPALGKNHYEHLYQKTRLGEIDTAHTPLTVELPNNTYVAIHEAALYDYGSMNLVPTEQGLASSVTPLKNGSIGGVDLPFDVPWRTIVLSDTAVGLSSSRIMLNLNQPSKIVDTSWIQPIKFMGIWWGMFIGYFTWSSGHKHGATTANAFRYINACKKLGIPALLIEGWNEGWDGDWTKNGDKMNHMQPYPDFDIKAVTDYARSQGVDIVGHHETSGNAKHYEWELPEAYDYYRHFGVRYIKTGYVSPRLNDDEFHSSQAGVRHYQKTVELAAERQIMLDIHEPVKGTGIERTWPNLLTREGVMGQEYEGGAVTPEHATVLPYTRLLAGPLDYTPGLFNLQGTSRKVRTTLTKQLAFYVTMYSPMQMVADLPEHYDDHPAFAFIEDVPTNWEETVPLDGVIGDYFVTARKDRHSDDWYVGGVTDESERTLVVRFDFLPQHRRYTATIYSDSPDGHWQDNPEAYRIEQKQVHKGESIEIYLAPGGGFAISLKPEGETSPPYPGVWA